MNAKRGTIRGGYVFLITVLVIGAIATSTAVSLVLLGLASLQSGLSVSQSAQAAELAQTCAERALRSLRSDLTYLGGETFTLEGGTCQIRTVAGSGNTDRAICTQGVSGQNYRRIEISLKKIYPSVVVSSWKEVSGFSLCP